MRRCRTNNPHAQNSTFPFNLHTKTHTTHTATCASLMQTSISVCRHCRTFTMLTNAGFLLRRPQDSHARENSLVNQHPKNDDTKPTTHTHVILPSTSMHTLTLGYCTEGNLRMPLAEVSPCSPGSSHNLNTHGRWVFSPLSQKECADQPSPLANQRPHST